MITHLVLGPPEHGVTRHGAALAAGGDAAHCVELRHVGEHARALRAVLAEDDSPIHVHLTDHLLGDDNAAIEEGVTVLGGSPRPVHVTLHDIPLPDEGEARFARRRDVYRRLVEQAASVQVCSEHEARALAAVTGRAASSFGVVQLPIDLDPVTPTQGWEKGPLGVLGFIHPGKDPVLAIEIGVVLVCDVVLLGAVGPGHDEFARGLVDQAREGGVTCEITGHLSEKEMDASIARVAVPLAPYRHVSASGSIGRWIAAGRRPVVMATPWTHELGHRAPWAVTIAEVGEFEDAARRAVADPDSTWWREAGPGLLTTREAAERQRELLDEAVAGGGA